MPVLTVAQQPAAVAKLLLGGVRGVVIGEGKKSGCEGCGGEWAGDVGVGEMWVGEESNGCVERVVLSGCAVGGVG